MKRHRYKICQTLLAALSKAVTERSWTFAWQRFSSIHQNKQHAAVTWHRLLNYRLSTTVCFRSVDLRLSWSGISLRQARRLHTFSKLLEMQLDKSIGSDSRSHINFFLKRCQSPCLRWPEKKRFPTLALSWIPHQRTAVHVICTQPICLPGWISGNTNYVTANESNAYYDCTTHGINDVATTAAKATSCQVQGL